MPVPKRARSKGTKSDGSESLQTFTRAGAPVYISVERAQGLGLELESLSAQMKDASDVYEWIHQNSWVTHDSLVRRAVSVWGEGSIDRLNSTLGLLERLERVYKSGS